MVLPLAPRNRNPPFLVLWCALVAVRPCCPWSPPCRRPFTRPFPSSALRLRPALMSARYPLRGPSLSGPPRGWVYRQARGRDKNPTEMLIGYWVGLPHSCWRGSWRPPKREKQEARSHFPFEGSETWISSNRTDSFTRALTHKPSISKATGENIKGSALLALVRESARVLAHHVVYHCQNSVSDAEPLCRPWRHLRLSYVSWATPG